MVMDIVLTIGFMVALMLARFALPAVATWLMGLALNRVASGA